MGGGGLHSYLFYTPNSGGQQSPQKQSTEQNNHVVQIIAHHSEQVFRSNASIHNRSCSHDMIAANTRLGLPCINHMVQIIAHHSEQVFRSNAAIHKRSCLHNMIAANTRLGLPCICKCTRTWRARTWVGVACTHTCSAHQIRVVSKNRTSEFRTGQPRGAN